MKKTQVWFRLTQLLTTLCNSNSRGGDDAPLTSERGKNSLNEKFNETVLILNSFLIN